MVTDLGRKMAKFKHNIIVTVRPLPKRHDLDRRRKKEALMEDRNPGKVTTDSTKVV